MVSRRMAPTETRRSRVRSGTRWRVCARAFRSIPRDKKRRGGGGPMRCPFCGFEDTQVKASRPTDDRASIRRRRLCPNCAARFTTFERVQLRELTVVKKDGERQPFERDKLARSLYIALRKRPVEGERIE